MHLNQVLRPNEGSIFDKSMPERSWKISDIWVTSHCHRTLAHPNKLKERWTYLTAGCEAPNRGLHQNAGAHTCGGQLGPG